MEKIDFSKVEAFSADGEFYDEDDQCIIDHGLDNLKEGESFTFYIGTKREFLHTDFFHKHLLNNLIESMQESACEEVGEVSDSYLSRLDTAENQDEFKKLVCNWIQEKAGSVSVFGVRDIQEVTCVWRGDSYEQVI